jgi:hypothetical protein
MALDFRSPTKRMDNRGCEDDVPATQSIQNLSTVLTNRAVNKEK